MQKNIFPFFKSKQSTKEKEKNSYWGTFREGNTHGRKYKKSDECFLCRIFIFLYKHFFCVTVYNIYWVTPLGKYEATLYEILNFCVKRNLDPGYYFIVEHLT